jgi:hypothetical protein
MLRLFTDFQAIDPDGCCWILKINEEDNREGENSAIFKKGDKVILDAYEDFELIGTLDYKYVEYLKRDAWVACPDWSTQRQRTSNA